MYRLAEAAAPPATTFIDAYPKSWNTLPQYDIRFFEDLNHVIQREPVLERDKAMMAMLASVGVVKGRPFEPDIEVSAAIEERVDCAFDAMQEYLTTPGVSMVPWWPERQWQVWNFAKGQPEAGFRYETNERILIDERAGGSYFWITCLPNNLGGGTIYLTGRRDSDGSLFNGTATYHLRVPADTPALDFWSVIVYSMATKGFVDGASRVGLSTPDLSDMNVNADGSANIYFSPVAPDGLESNWMETGEDFFLFFRLYGPDRALLDKTWTLPDVERID